MVTHLPVPRMFSYGIFDCRKVFMLASVCSVQSKFFYKLRASDNVEAEKLYFPADPPIPIK